MPLFVLRIARSRKDESTVTNSHRIAALTTLAGLALSAAAAPATHAVLGDDHQLPRFSSGHNLPAQRSALPAHRQLERIAVEQDRTRVVVELGENPSAAQRDALRAAGVTLLSPLGNGAFFATVDRAGLRSRAATDAVPMTAVHGIDPAWKMDARLAAGRDAPRHSLVAETMPGRADVTEANPIIGLYVLFHPDVQLGDDLERMLETAGATVRDSILSLNGYVVEATPTVARALAANDAVQWIEPALPKLSENNAEAAVMTQAADADTAPYGLDGTGVTAFIYDGGNILANHNDFQNRATVIAGDTSGLSDHATHVAGTVGSRGTHTGMAPEVTILSAGFEWDGSGTFLYTNPGDFEADYTDAIALGADLSNNSIGTNTAPNGFDCDITGDYGVMSSLIDAAVLGSLGGDIVVFWANGNERQTTRCGSTYSTTAPPATAKNHITVGALNANNDTVTSFTSWGPVDDGRLKPDIAAPGCSSVGDGGITSTSSGGGYSVKCGTSMASPAAAGCGVLIIEDWRNQFPGEGNPRNATVKALLAQDAQDVGNPGPDYQTGYGSIRVLDSIDTLRAGRVSEDSVGAGASRSYRMPVSAGETFKVTIAWDDAPGVPNTTKALVNDLDLRVFDPAGNRVFPWTLDPASPGLPATQDQVDRINNIEQVFIASATGGVYTVEVNGFDVPQGPQEFSIVSSHDLADSMSVAITNPIPNFVAPGTVVSVDVAIDPFGETITPGSETLSYRVGESGSFTTVPLASTGLNTYTGDLPAALCGSAIQYYVSAEGSESGLLNQPTDGAANPASFEVGEVLVPFADDLEASVAGWAIGDPSDTATTGAWEWATPEATAAQPGSAFSGSLCFVTGAAAGAGLGTFDIDEGDTTLVTPAIDIAGVENPEISYYRWYSNNTGQSPNADIFVVEISVDGGPWLPVETVGPTGSGTVGGWINHAFDLGAVAGTTTASDFRLRFNASDLGGGSIVEAAIDDISVSAFTCVDAVACSPADVTTDATSNGMPDGQVTLSDFSYYLSLWGASDPAADLTTDATANGIPDGSVTLSDFSFYLSLWGAGCP